MTQWDIDSFSKPGSLAWIALDEFNEQLRKDFQEDARKFQEEVLDRLTQQWYPGYVARESKNKRRKELPVHLL